MGEFRAWLRPDLRGDCLLGHHIQPSILEVPCPCQPGGDLLVEACQNNSLSLCASNTGTGPFTYQWLRDGLPIPGATGRCLDLISVKYADSGEYCVLVTGACGTAKVCARLIVRPFVEMVPPCSWRAGRCHGAVRQRRAAVACARRDRHGQLRHERRYLATLPSAAAFARGSSSAAGRP